MAATQPIENLFSEPEFRGQTACSLPETHELGWGAKPPTSINGSPGRNKPFASQNLVSRKTYLSVGWLPSVLILCRKVLVVTAAAAPTHAKAA